MPCLGTKLQSHTFLDILAADSFFSSRDGVHSIPVETLLALLRDSLSLGETVPKDLCDILVGLVPQSDVGVATTRVPVFNDDVQNPNYGYRSFGVLMHPVYNTPTATYDRRRELLAVDDLMDDPITSRFRRMYQLDLKNHFIILFSYTATSATRTRESQHSSRNRHPSPFIQSPFTNSPTNRGSRASSLFDYSLPSPVSGLGEGEGNFDTNLPTFGDISPGISAHGSPAAAHFADGNFGPGNMPPSMPPAMPGPPIEDPAAVVAICRQLGIPDDILDGATYNRDSNGLLAMVKNYRSMAAVLIGLGFRFNARDQFSPSSFVTIEGRSLMASKAVVAFGWAPDSYKHKCWWLGWAEDMALSSQWKGSAPGNGESSLSAIYTSSDIYAN